MIRLEQIYLPKFSAFKFIQLTSSDDIRVDHVSVDTMDYLGLAFSNLFMNIISGL